jgi:hypothetical protein
MATTHQKPLSTMPKPRHIGRDKTTANPYPPVVLRANQPNAPEPEPLTTPPPLDTEKTKTKTDEYLDYFVSEMKRYLVSRTTTTAPTVGMLFYPICFFVAVSSYSFLP